MLRCVSILLSIFLCIFVFSGVGVWVWEGMYVVWRCEEVLMCMCTDIHQLALHRPQSKHHTRRGGYAVLSVEEEVGEGKSWTDCSSSSYGSSSGSY